jgi:hypothetical protein
MKLSKLKNILLLIITPLMLFFCYSIYEESDNIPTDDVLLYVKPIDSVYQVLHTSKLYGTNYSILVKFSLKKETFVADSLSFILTNYGGPIHYKIDSVSIDTNNDFNFTLSKSFFKQENEPLILDCSENNYVIEIDSIKDSHIEINNFFGGTTNEKILLGINNLNGQDFCCGRRCKFQFTN